MVPPRLKLVSDNSHDRPDSQAAEDVADREDLPRLRDPEAAVEQLNMTGRPEKLRRLEALLFAASTPLDEKALAKSLEPDDDIESLMAELRDEYAARGVNLQRVAGKWQFRTASDLSFLMEHQQVEQRKLSKAALETLAIIAYHQPVTRAEIEEVRGVSTSSGTLDVLMETGWIRPRGRRRAPGRPLTYGTTETFLAHFGLDNIRDLPGLSELKATGLLDGNLPPDFKVPEPTDVAALMLDELPLTEEDDEDDDDDTQESLALDDDEEAIDEDDDETADELVSETKAKGSDDNS